ncbi:MAG: MFS transporter [Patescibacteria group bacterium]
MKRFVPVFVITVFLSFHYGAILYVNSSLLGKFFNQNTVSLLFILGAVASCILFLFTAQLIEWFGKRLLLLILLSVSTLTTLGLAFAQTGANAAVYFLAHECVLLTIYYCLDIFLEEVSLDGNTGEVRGIYLTLINLGIAAGPIILLIFGDDETFKPIYILATVLLIVPLVMTIFTLKSRMPKWHGITHRHIFLPFRAWWRHGALRRITIARLILESFFAFMIIYTPVYLHNNLGFEWSELGIIFTVMLLPFVLFQWPAGELADRYYGEKEILCIGFLITALSLAVMPFLGKIFMAWLFILFVSRVGASFVEIMTESYFFKHVGPRDTGLISIFRLTRPVSIILGAGAGVLALSFLTFEQVFFVLAAIVLLGLKVSLALRDTK